LAIEKQDGVHAAPVDFHVVLAYFSNIDAASTAFRFGDSQYLPARSYHRPIGTLEAPQVRLLPV